MGNVRLWGWVWVCLAWASLTTSCVHAEETYNSCPSGIYDVPHVFMPHVEQSDLAAGSLSLNDIFNVGAAWAEIRFNLCDGQGRPATTGDGSKRVAGQPAMLRTSGPEASSCFGCHAQPRSGGAGDFVANTFNGTETLDPVTMSISPDLSNERGTPGMFGSGYIELLGREMTADLQAQAAQYAADEYSGTVTFKTKGVKFDVKFKNGVVKKTWGIDTDLVVKPFGAGGTKVSLRQFTVEALNRHHGIQAEERYDIFIGDPDFDEDGFSREMTVGDVTTITMWQAMLDRPLPEASDDPEEQAAIDAGEELFDDIGCTGCHKSELVLDNRRFCEPNPYNPGSLFTDQSLKVCVLLDYDTQDLTKQDDTDANAPPADTALPIYAYTDLKRHHMCDDPADVVDPIRTLCNESHDEGRPAQDGYPGAEFFMTADLWSTGESAPYGHNNHFPLLSEVILAHGGEARKSRDRYAALADDDQRAVILWLRSPKILDQPVRLEDG